MKNEPLALCIPALTWRTDFLVGAGIAARMNGHYPDGLGRADRSLKTRSSPIAVAFMHGRLAHSRQRG